MKANKREKPVEIIDFSYIFDRHPKSEFVAVGRRKKIMESIDEFLTADEVRSPITFVMGESGIGKTALMANYVVDKQDNIVHYFCESDNRAHLDPEVFARHLYCDLGRKHRMSLDISGVQVRDIYDKVNRRIQEIHERCAHSRQFQAVFIDGVDEAVPPNNQRTHMIDSIIDALNSLHFPPSFRVVISASRDIGELKYYDSEAAKMVMTAGDSENRIDIRMYFFQHLKPTVNQLLDFSSLMSAADGNFEYASLVVRLMKSRDIELGQLREESKKGFINLLDHKMRRIRQSVTEPVYEDIVRLMRLISIMWSPTGPAELSEILDLGLKRQDACFNEIQIFLDRSSWDGPQRTCRWHHVSIRRYMLDDERFSEGQRAALLESIVCYYEKRFSRTMILESDREAIRNLPIYYHWLACIHNTAHYYSKMILFMRHTYLRKLPDNELVHFTSWSWQALTDQLNSACRIDLAEDAIFFALIYFVALYHTYDRKLDMMLASFFHNQMRKSLQSVDTRTELQTTKRQLVALEQFEMVMDKFSNVHNEFDDVSRVYDLCDHYAKEWGASEVTATADSKVDVISTLSFPVVKADRPLVVTELTYAVYENWKDPKPGTVAGQLLELTEKRDHGKYDVWIREPASEVYHLARKIEPTPEDRLVRMMKTILRWAHEGHVPLVELYKSLRPRATVNIGEAMRNKRHIRNALYECRKLFGDCFEVEWPDDEPFPRMIIKQTFSYCLIEPTSPSE